jgi:excisionase family DNA binding protein
MDDYTSILPLLLTPKDLMRHFGISQATMYRIIGKREIAFVKVKGQLRFTRADVNKYLEKNRVKSSDEYGITEKK